MNNESESWLDAEKIKQALACEPLYTQEQLEEARKMGMQQERALWNLSESTKEIMNTHLVKELTNDEIMQAAMEASVSSKNWGYFQIDFARAILKKAQEK